jgi:hypothetical protein
MIRQHTRRKKRVIYRSARTGRVVTEKFALKHPATTVKEQIEPHASKRERTDHDRR